YTLGPTVVYAIVAALYVLGSSLVAFVRAAAPGDGGPAMTSDSLFSGIAFIVRERLLLGLLSLDLFAVLLGGATALLPIYARDILGTGPFGLGLLRAAPACGALAMSPRCCRSTRVTSSAQGRLASACCARLRLVARSRCPSCSRAVRSGAARDRC